MNYKVFVSKTFQKKFYQIQKNKQKLIRTSLEELKKDPFKSRTNCDIKLLVDTKPKKYRLRIGELRILYLIEQKHVKVIDLVKRQTAYSKLE